MHVLYNAQLLVHARFVQKALHMLLDLTQVSLNHGKQSFTMKSLFQGNAPPLDDNEDLLVGCRTLTETVIALAQVSEGAVAQTLW